MRRAGLAADCSVCRGLCCVAKSFEAGGSFAFAKPAHVPCPHLDGEHRCSIYQEREERGFAGCAAFDCHGAGPRATALLDRARRADVLVAFDVLCDIQEARWLLERARALLPAESELEREIARRQLSLEDVAERDAEELRRVDVDAIVVETRALLRRVGAALGSREAVRRRLQVVG